MNEKFRILLSDRVNRYGLVLAILVLLSGFIGFAIKVWNLPPVVPIFYHRPYGLSQLGMPIHLALVLSAASVVLIINLTLAHMLYKSIILLARILIWVSVVVSLLATITVIRVLFLVT